MNDEEFKTLKAEHDAWYAEYCIKRDARKKEIEVIINDIWWRINKIVWNDKENSVEIHAEDQGGRPFLAFQFSLQMESWLDHLEYVLHNIKNKKGE